MCDARLAGISICMAKHFYHVSLVLSLPLRSDLFLSDIKELLRRLHNFNDKRCRP